MSAFNFRLRFILSPHDAILINEARVALPSDETGVNLQLKSRDESESIEKTKDLVVLGQKWDSEEMAQTAGIRVKNALMFALAAMRIGADFGDRSGSFFFPAGLQLLEKKVGQRVLNDVHGLMTFNADPSPLFVSLPSPRIIRALKSDRFFNFFERAYRKNCMPSARESLAFELFNASFFEKTPEQDSCRW